MDLQLRDWRDGDAEPWIRVRRTLPPPISDENLRAIAAGERLPFLFRTVATLEDSPVGWASMSQYSDDRVQRLTLVVAPEARGQGVGSRLWAAVPKPTQSGLMVWADPDDARSLAVAGRWGFEPVSRGMTSRAALTSRPPQPAVPDGYRLSIAESTAVDDVRVDVILRRSATYPEAALESPMTVATLRTMFPTMFWVLVESPDGELAAVSAALREHDDEWFVIYTGVLPSHRRLGLARAVKAQLHAEVWSRGGRWIYTTNEADNHEIRALNASLGYEVTSSELRLLRPRPA